MKHKPNESAQRNGSTHTAHRCLCENGRGIKLIKTGETIESIDTAQLPQCTAKLKAMATTDASGKNARIPDEQTCVKSSISASLRKQVGGPVELTAGFPNAADIWRSVSQERQQP